MACLTIYVKDNSYQCGEAIDLASRVKQRIPQLELEVVNIDRGYDKDSIIVSEEPVFVLDHEVLHIGNPDEDSLIKALLALGKPSVN